MPRLVIRLEDVCLETPAGRPLLREVTLDLTRGWTAIAGANGAGKSSLLRLIAGEREPSAGLVRLLPPEARIAFVRQEQAEPTDAELAFVHDARGEARGLRAELGVGDSLSMEALARLSPGERRRIQIGAAIWQGADILLCDEPDAHLDATARKKLVRAMRAFRGIGAVVSHHRELIDEVAMWTVLLEGQRARIFEGGYSAARAAREIEIATIEGERTRAARALGRARVAHDQTRRRHEAADREQSASRRMKSVRDHDGSSSARKFRAEQATKTLGRIEGVRAAKVARAEEALASIHLEPSFGAEVRFRARPAPSGRVATLVQDELRAGHEGPLILRRPSIVVSSRSRIRVTGDNGAGKTTLLVALAAHAAPDVLYVPQVLDARARTAIAEELSASSRDERGRWLSLFASLGADPSPILSTPCPSPGEARKLAIAKGLAREVSGLILDEPTNDLDLPSIERLERALAAYEGALVFASHDESFARATETERWLLGGGALMVA